MIAVEMEEGTNYSLFDTGPMHLTPMRKHQADTMRGHDYRAGDANPFSFPTLCGMDRNNLVMIGRLMTSRELRLWCGVPTGKCGRCIQLAYEQLAREAERSDRGA